MGVSFVIILENRAGRAQEEISLALGARRIPNEWTCFSHEGRSYASWHGAPRYFAREEDPEQWKALRKYLVRAWEFLGDGAVYVGNDVLHLETPEDATDRCPFFLPLRVPDEWLTQPDVASHPELAQIQELEGLTW